MSRPHLFAQLYGYAVCLIAVIVGLIGGTGVVNAAFDLSDPMHSGQWAGGPELPPTFDEYYAQRRGALPNTTGSAQATTLSEETLRRIYDSEQKERLAARRFHATKNLVSSALLLAAAIFLFTWHWRWLRRLPDTTTSTA